jgi:hypothetical protein
VTSQVLFLFSHVTPFIRHSLFSLQLHIHFFFSPTIWPLSVVIEK